MEDSTNKNGSQVEGENGMSKKSTNTTDPKLYLKARTSGICVVKWISSFFKSYFTIN